MSMGRLRLSLFLLFWLSVVGSVRAATITQGAVELESCGADCTFSGTWVTATGIGNTFVSSGTAGAYVEFDAQGKSLIIYRFVTDTAPSMSVCVESDCETVVNYSSAPLNAPIVFDLTGGTDTVRITGTNVLLDKIMILAAPGDGSPFPTPTPSPSNNVVFSVQPECRYETLDETIVSVCYTITGGDFGIIIFLAFISFALVALILVIRWQQNG